MRSRLHTSFAFRPRRALIVWLTLAAIITGATRPVHAAHGGMGEFPSTAGGRYVAMVSPTNGESFMTPLSLRLIAAAHDDNYYTNDDCQGGEGHGAAAD